EFDYANGRTVNTSTSGIKAYLNNFTLSGKGGDMRSSRQDVSAYVQGIRLRAFNGCRIEGINFTGTLYDGIYCTAPSVFIEINGCRFFGLHRDGIAFCAFAGNFTTEIWITHNDFGWIGRYGILLDLAGAIAPTPNILYNTFEFVYPESYYLR